MVYIKILKIIIGAVLISLGLAGLFIPIVPGIILIGACLVLVGIKMDYLKKMLARLLRKMGF